IAELPPEIQERLDDKTTDITARISFARQLVHDYGDVTVLIAENIACDGNGSADRDVPVEKQNEITDQLGFREKTFEAISRYKWRTKSETHPDLILLVTEGPLNMGEPSELFPEGR